MSRYEELAASIQKIQQPLADDYQELLRSVPGGVHEKLVESMIQSQEFQLDCLKLLQRRVPDQFEAFGTITHRDVNFREGADGKAPLIRKLQRGTRVVIKSRDGFWLNIELWDGTDGYVFKDYVQSD